MDIRKIKKLIEMLQESDLTEIEVGQGDESVRITRGGASQFVAATPISNQTIADDRNTNMCASAIMRY